MLEAWENLGKLFWGLMLCGAVVVGIALFLAIMNQAGFNQYRRFQSYEKKRRAWAKSIGSKGEP